MKRKFISPFVLLIIVLIVSCDEKTSNTPKEEEQETQFATWLMIWDRASESWWNADEHNGIKVFVNGKWQSVNWMDHDQADEFVQNVKDAGINILIADLTNGWNWLDEEVQYIQSLCKRHGMKLCIAENSQGDVAGFEQRAKDVYDRFVSSNSPFGKDTYFYKEGKPVIICYSIRDWYNAYRASNGEYTKKFNLIWASGEDSDTNKWGWQLEPWVGPMPSSDAMFVTPSIRWDFHEPASDEKWLSSLSWLDYTFLTAKKNKSNFIIVASYDDIDERNGWLVANTEDAIAGRQMRDKSGKLSTDAYYERVKQWVKGIPKSNEGGYVGDGAYRIVNENSNKYLSLTDTEGGKGALAIQKSGSSIPLNDYFWLYHLGDNQYKILALNKGLSLTVPEASLVDGIQIKDSLVNDVPWQRWILENAGSGQFKIRNLNSDKVLAVSGGSQAENASIVQEESMQGKKSQLWKFDKISAINDLE